jgi:hypothetical protein
MIRRILSLICSLFNGQPYRECGPLTDFACDKDFATMCFNVALADWESKAHSSCFRGEEGRPKAFHDFLRHACTSISENKVDMVISPVAAHYELAPFRDGVDCVLDQVEEDSSYFHGIKFYPRRVLNEVFHFDGFGFAAGLYVIENHKIEVKIFSDWRLFPKTYLLTSLLAP